MLTTEIITYMTSGRMTALRELGVALDYRDWHHFLQRLPNISHVRSLYIPHIADHPHGANIDPRDLALQVVDIVTLRPEVELCYMGIATKCFEILENKAQQYDFQTGDAYTTTDGPGASGYAPINDGEITDEDEEEDIEDEDDGDGEDGDAAEDEDDDPINDDLLDDDDDDLYSNDGDHVGGKKAPKLRLREILFYDDKVSIFKARHGKL